MHRQALINKLENYNPEFEAEQEFRVRFLDFIKNNPDCFERTLLEGHITGSAWIVNHDRTKFLMTHHHKLDRWLQLGGHADGDSDIINVATNEALEESGLKSIKLIIQDIFDIDIHTIPARKQDPEHLHYDVRFVFEADEQEPLVVSNESKNLGWLTYEELIKTCGENDSIFRMAEKTRRKSLLKN
ncbi:MAG: NUDIX hydrolase [Fulvivirga sp.]